MKRIAKLMLMAFLAATTLAGCGSGEYTTTTSPCVYVADYANNRIESGGMSLPD